MKIINIKHLAYFIELSKTLNFSLAAQKLGISQPTLTQALKKAEADLGVDLFERDGRKLKITEYGRIFLDSCGYITDLYDDTLRRIDDLKYGRTGSIRIGIAPSRAPFTIPNALKQFRRIYPDVRLDISEMLTANIEKNVENGLLDLGVLVVYDSKNVRIEYLPIETENIIIAVHHDLLPDKLRLSGSENAVAKADLNDFTDIPFVLLGEDQLIVSQFKDLCTEKNVPINCVARCRNVETSLATANAGIGATLVTSTGMDYYHSAFPELRYFDVSDDVLDRSICVIHRKNQYIDPPLQKLMEIILHKGDR
ncbi:MAG: LysR family transcriptional regulator [Clostridia bacterium]|nr:LysR family transcriptional regulator [Clostridia bacterium]